MIPDMVRNGAVGSIKGVILYDLTTRVLPGFLQSVSNAVANRFKKRSDTILNRLKCEDKVKPKAGSLVIESNITVPNDMFDAVLSYASDLPQARYVKRTNRGIFIVETKEEVPLAHDFFFRKLHEVVTDGEVEKMRIEVYSYTKDIVQLRDYVTDMQDTYKKNKNNSLGRQIYYFDEMPVQPIKCVDHNNGSPRIVNDLTKSPPAITFSMFPLHTNKSLKNIYGTSVVKAKKRVDFFLNNPEWYRVKGIPYTLGILLHGVPGCGKTSFIKGLARDTGRHVVNVKLNEATTVRQINNLFYSPRISVIGEGMTSAYDIPMDKRIIVMEDVDCLSNVISRDIHDVAGTNGTTNHTEGINLSILLNILDGVLETPGRIVIMTTNAPEKLDAALIRPGRIDISLEFNKCTADDIMDMVAGLGGVVVDRDYYRDRLVAGAWTPAEVTKVLFENIDNPIVALESFVKIDVDEVQIDVDEVQIDVDEVQIDEAPIIEPEVCIGELVDICKITDVLRVPNIDEIFPFSDHLVYVQNMT
jgi:hypothetical protein